MPAVASLTHVCIMVNQAVKITKVKDLALIFRLVSLVGLYLSSKNILSKHLCP